MNCVAYGDSDLNEAWDSLARLCFMQLQIAIYAEKLLVYY